MRTRRRLEYEVINYQRDTEYDATKYRNQIPPPLSLHSEQHFTRLTTINLIMNVIHRDLKRDT
jgi:hypothetical protein